jgi:hypothetical protein
MGRRQRRGGTYQTSPHERSTPESGARGGYDGHKKHKKGSKVHAVVDTLGHLLALFVTPANEQERARVGELAEAVQEEATGESVELAYVDQGYAAGEQPAEEAEAHGMRDWRWSSTKRRNGASCSCRGDGSWNAISPGHRGFGGWSRITRGCPILWLGCTSSRLLVSSSSKRPLSSVWVHNTL